ncbi:MAG TPA: hypothetical protein VHS99_22115 [Chloroflexota bacterium]|jgi:hypothetical protein|nr:hypothetical protein [Chloroflexota bacterium]
MRYDRANVEAWLNWFCDPDTADEEALLRALRSIPPDRDTWLDAVTRLRERLEHERERVAAVYAGEPGEGTQASPADPDAQLWALVEHKADLVDDALRRRQNRGY